MPHHNSSTINSGNAETRRSSVARSVKSACSRASSAIEKATSTITALKSRKLEEEEETESLSSSHWETDLEDGDDDDNDDDDDEYDPKKPMEPEKKAYLKVCDQLEVTPVSRFGNEIGQEEIRINHRFLKESGARAVASILVHNKTTSKVNMSSNGMNARSGVYMGQVLRKNRVLTELNLANNNIKKEGIIALTDALIENTVITRLDLSGNGLKDKDAKVLSDGIENNSTLQYLNLSYNKFAEDSGVYFGAALTYNNGLRELDLSWNHIRRDGAVGISKSLRYNDTLEKLNLSWNGFDDVGTQQLGESLKKNTSLLEINLSNNRLSDEGFKNISIGLDGNETLAILNLSRNPVFNACQGSNKILELLYKKRCALQVLEIIDIKLDADCAALLMKVLQSRQDIKVQHGCKKKDTFASKKREVSPIDLMRDYLLKNKLHAFDLFKKLDINCQFRDSLSRQEFVDGMKRLKVMNAFYIDKLVEMLDSDGDGEIDYSEFAKMQ